MKARYALLALTLPLLAACSNSSGHGGGFASTAAGVTSTSPTPLGSGTAAGSTSSSAAAVPLGPLAQKAQAFQAVMEAWHLGQGQVQDVKLDPSGQVKRLGGAPSRCLWTGFYAGSQALRYRNTQDPAALVALERAMWTLHDLHEVTGLPGVIARGFDDAAIETQGYPGSRRFAGMNYNKGSASRDQYAGWFYGVALGYDQVQDPALKAAIRADVAAVCDKLMANDLKMESPWGPQGTVEIFFNLNPDDFYQDSITPQTWATVDDFPFNLITKSVPYSQPLADAIKNAKMPPIRAGEALRAVFFFTVAEHVTGDPRYGTFKRQLLFGPKDFARVIDQYLNILDDLLYGKNLPVVEQALRTLFTALGDVFQAYLVATGSSAIVTQLLVPVAAAGLSGWLSGVLADALAWIHAPNNQARLAQVVQHARLAVLILSLVGQRSLAQQLDDLINRYGVNLNHQGLIDFARTVRSHLGTNLTLMPLAALIQLEQDPAVVAIYKRAFDRSWEYLQDDANPVVNLLHHGYGLVGGPKDVPESLDQLQRYPVDLSMTAVDNGNWPGLVLSPWPDRFGKTGNLALVPDYFPIDHRAPDVFPWRGHPRQIKSGGNDPTLKVAPLGYLVPYWMARDLGVITAAD
ncbi:MAG: hypothetical protein AB7N76_33095 [Planctomycetota bacterium]